MHSCIYQGRVQHVRYHPVEHRFRYPFLAFYLDLDEVPALARRSGLLSSCRWAGVSYRREDHVGDAAVPLADTIRDMIVRVTGERPDGPIRLLTQLRCFGLYFSPLNLYYCFGEMEDRVEMVVAEVSNTPWNERHHYVLWRGNQRAESERLHFRHAKNFHVSPFMGMEQSYDWKLSVPDSRLRVYLSSWEGGKRMFDAGMTLLRTPLTRGEILRSHIRHPMMTFQILAAIYHQALKLWRKKCPYYPHPRTQTATPPTPN